jgi:hypothetical protein
MDEYSTLEWAGDAATFPCAGDVKRLDEGEGEAGVETAGVPTPDINSAKGPVGWAANWPTLFNP